MAAAAELQRQVLSEQHRQARNKLRLSLNQRGGDVEPNPRIVEGNLKVMIEVYELMTEAHVRYVGETQ